MAFAGVDHDQGSALDQLGDPGPDGSVGAAHQLVDVLGGPGALSVEAQGHQDVLRLGGDFWCGGIFVRDRKCLYTGMKVATGDEGRNFNLAHHGGSRR